MSKFLVRLVAGLLVMYGIVFAVGLSIGAFEENVHAHHASWESYDQENLKKLDAGCPSAVFVAPHGDLIQCQVSEEPKADKPETVAYFQTRLEAAIYVFTKIYAYNRYYEFGGVILRTPQGFVFISPRTQRHGTDVEFDEDPDSYDFPIVASYHAHPCLKGVVPSVFSPQDLAGVRTTKTPGYILDECTGSIHYWAPGDGYLGAEDLLKLGVTPLMLQRGIQMSPGTIVGHIDVTGEVLN